MNLKKLSTLSITFIALLVFAASAQMAMADSVNTYGDAAVVTGPDAQPAWQLSSTSSGLGYAGLYDTITGVLTPTTLTELSANYVMTTGTFGSGAPRFSISDSSGNEAWIYFGTPTGGGLFSDPNFGQSTYANTGNYADLTSSAIRVYSNGFAGFGNGNLGQTWAQFLADPGVAGAQISYIYLDLDGNYGGITANDQVMDVGSFSVNGTSYVPTSSVPDGGTTLGLFAVSAFLLLGLRKMVRA